MPGDPSGTPPSNERSVSSLIASVVSLLGGILAIILGVIQIGTSTHSWRSIGTLIIGFVLATVAMLLWRQPRIRDILAKVAHWQVRVSYVTLAALLLAGVGLTFVGNSSSATTPGGGTASSSPTGPSVQTPSPSTSASVIDLPSPANSPGPSASPAASVSSPAPPASVSSPAAQDRCPDTLNVPPDPPQSAFLITVNVTCPVPAGNQLILVSEIQNADGRGDTEFYLVTKWAIRTDTAAAQTFRSTPSAGLRTYYIISVTANQLAQITDPSNTVSDGGHYSLLDAPVASNKQPNKTQ